MRSHTVVQGECLSSLAARLGLQGQDLHDHPANADLKTKRPNPNILAPGDVVMLPQPNEKWVAVTTTRVHRFVMKRQIVKFRIAILNAYLEPYEGKRFAIEVEGTEAKGKTVAGGWIECDIPALAESGRLRVWLTEDDSDPEPHIDRELAIGHLDPVDLVSGVQARLANLGYGCEVTGESDDATNRAVQRFRARNGQAQDEGSNAGESSAQPDPGNSGNADDPEGSNQAGASERDEPASTAQHVQKPIDDTLRQKLRGLYEGG